MGINAHCFSFNMAKTQSFQTMKTGSMKYEKLLECGKGLK